MVSADREAFNNGITALAGMYARALSPMTVQGYWITLEDLALDAVLAAMRSSLRVAKMMPTPALLRELVIEKGNKLPALSAFKAPKWTDYQKWEAAQLKQVGARRWAAMTQQERDTWTAGCLAQWDSMNDNARTGAGKWDANTALEEAPF